MNNIIPFIIKRNDTLPALSITIRTRGEMNELLPYDLTDADTVTFSMSDQYGNLKISSQSAQVTSASAGTIQYDWVTGDTDTEGTYNGEFEIIFNDSNKLSIPTLGSLDIKIVKDINAI